MGTREDYEWSKSKVAEFELDKKYTVLFSVVFDELEPLTLVNWILEDKLNVRYQLQMHKFIWEPRY